MTDVIQIRIEAEKLYKKKQQQKNANHTTQKYRNIKTEKEWGKRRKNVPLSVYNYEWLNIEFIDNFE